MATHNAPVTRAGRFGDWLAAQQAGVTVPRLLETLAVAVGIIAAAVLLAEVEPVAGVWLLLTGLLAEAFLLAWKSMRAPWDRLHDEEGPCSSLSIR